MRENPYLEIWDIDYYSTSDEEDDDDESKESEDEKSSNDSTASPGQNTAKQRMYWRNGIFISFALVYL